MAKSLSINRNKVACQTNVFIILQLAGSMGGQACQTDFEEENGVVLFAGDAFFFLRQSRKNTPHIRIGISGVFFSEKVEVLGLQKDSRYHKYQFPMGKVKNKIMGRIFSIHRKYRFVKCIFEDWYDKTDSENIFTRQQPVA